MLDLQLNLTTQEDYLTSLALLRQRITVGRTRNNLPSALRISVQLPYGHVELFLQTSNLYLIGFLGSGKTIYALKDDEEPAEKIIKNSGRLNPGEELVTLGLYGDHGSLGTFSSEFTYSELSMCRSLALYEKGQQYAGVRRAMSLLVCMLCEGARFLEVQNAFAGVGHIPGRLAPQPLSGEGVWGSSIKASEVVNYWSNATRARTVAERYGLGVSQGHKYALQLNTACDRLEEALQLMGKQVSRTALWNWIAGKSQLGLMDLESQSSIAGVLNDTRHLVKTVKLNNGEAVAEFVAALKNETAVEASLGLLLPAVQ